MTSIQLTLVLPLPKEREDIPRWNYFSFFKSLLSPPPLPPPLFLVRYSDKLTTEAFSKKRKRMIKPTSTNSFRKQKRVWFAHKHFSTSSSSLAHNNYLLSFMKIQMFWNDRKGELEDHILLRGGCFCERSGIAEEEIAVKWCSEIISLKRKCLLIQLGLRLQIVMIWCYSYRARDWSTNNDVRKKWEHKVCHSSMSYRYMLHAITQGLLNGLLPRPGVICINLQRGPFACKMFRLILLSDFCVQVGRAWM